MKVKGHKNEIRAIACKLFHSQTSFVIPRYNTINLSNDISFLDLAVRSRSKVTDVVEVSAFSECFCF